MTPKAVLWDMDGTLVDSEPLHTEALVGALASLGLVAPPNLHDRVLGVAAGPVYEMLKREAGLDLPFDDWILLKYEHYLPRAQALKPRPGAMEILRDLMAKGVAQAIVSNSDRLVVDANLRAVGLQFPGMKTVSRNDVRAGKPDPEPFLRGAWLCRVEPADCAVMEDSVTGATAGIAAGMKTIFWPETPLQGPAGAHAATTADDVRALLGLAASA